MTLLKNFKKVRKMGIEKFIVDKEKRMELVDIGDL